MFKILFKTLNYGFMILLIIIALSYIWQSEMSKKKEIARFGDNISNLQKEKFMCIGKGVADTLVQGYFSINPDEKTLTFSHTGGILGSLINYPKRIIYKIKLSNGNALITEDYTYTWTNLANDKLNFITYISTDDKNIFYLYFKDSASKRPREFKDCMKV